ncbi:hypothetical protein BCR42DRAFT_405039, partial [Absidia repens]
MPLEICAKQHRKRYSAKQHQHADPTKKQRKFALPHTTNSVVIPSMPNLVCQVLFRQFLSALIEKVALN